MTTTTCVCIVLCVLIMAMFTFFTIVYLSELKREKQLRGMISEENNKLHAMMSSGKLPVVLMDVPVKPQETAPKAKPIVSDKDKKNIN